MVNFTDSVLSINLTKSQNVLKTQCPKIKKIIIMPIEQHYKEFMIGLKKMICIQRTTAN